MQFRRISVGVISAAVVLSAAALLTAGPLDPPSGSIAPSYKTLSEVEPRIALTQATAAGDADSVFRINKPGSYYLTEGFTATVNKSAIEIASSNVTIDLNGCTITSIASLAAIRLSVDNRINISIKNGHIGTSFGPGIEINKGPSGDTTSGGLIADVVVTGVGGTAFRVGDGVIFNRCSASNAGSYGFVAGKAATFMNCTAFSNGDHGFYAGAASTLVGCSSLENGGPGFYTGDGSSLTNCTARSNGHMGFDTTNCTLTGCIASLNANTGISLFRGTALNCTANENAGLGFSASNAVITACISNSNGYFGFSAGSSTITGCTANGNTLDGISVNDRSHVYGNTCANNDGGGITVDDDDCRIEQNNCTANLYGIRITGTGNIIIRNTCSGNTTNWSIVANNSVAPIVVTSKTSSSISGNSSSAALGSTDPNANFTY